MGVSPSTYAGLFVVADGVDQVGDVRAAITEVGFTTSAPENVLASVDRYLRVVEIILAAVGAIALAVAALGIANALLAAVRERRVEIGVLKAVGARDGDVRRVFLVEAAALGLIGGCAGATVGWGIARLVGEIVNRYLAGEGLATVTIDFPAAIMAATVLGTTLLAVVAGTVPAARAARLPASDAMGGS
jgi:putative ABC transport system permease protein